MNKKFLIKEIHICPIYKDGNNFKPDMKYPTRNCVIDEEREIAIDIKTKLKYDYIKTMSRLYFMSQSYKKIKGDNRVAIFPYSSILSTGYTENEVSEIIEKLKNNEDFPNGNDVYNNEEYLQYLEEEKLNYEKTKQKIKKFRKNVK